VTPVEWCPTRFVVSNVADLDVANNFFFSASLNNIDYLNLLLDLGGSGE